MPTYCGCIQYNKYVLWIIIHILLKLINYLLYIIMIGSAIEHSIDHDGSIDLSIE